MTSNSIQGFTNINFNFHRGKTFHEACKYIHENKTILFNSITNVWLNMNRFNVMFITTKSLHLDLSHGYEVYTNTQNIKIPAFYVF